MIFSLILVFLAVVLTGISQVLLKTGSARVGNGKYSVLDAYLNIPALFAYGLLVFVTILSVIALKEIPLKTFYAVASMNFVIVAVLSWGILKEKITRNAVIAVVLISLGVIIFNL